MKKYILLLCLLVFSLYAHSVHHEVANKGVSVKIFYDNDDPASYAQYEIFKHNETIPYAKGRTDKHGVVSFLPDEATDWRIKVIDESDHGYHGKEVIIKTDKSTIVSDMSKSVFEKYSKIITGVSILFGLFGVASIITNKRKARTKDA